MNVLKKISNKLFSTTASGMYMILFAIAIAAATFVENDFGTSSAQKIIFKARWFELLLVLFAVANLVNMLKFNLIKQKKWATLAFHASMTIILLGAGVTRYFGFEGMMHIRQDSSSNYFLSADTYLNFEATQKGEKFIFDEPVLFATLGDNSFEETYSVGGQAFKVEVTEFMPNPKEKMVDDDEGLPTLKVVIGGANGREEYYVKQGTRSRIRGTRFNFTTPEMPNAFNIKYENDELFAKASVDYKQTVMASQTQSTLEAGVYHPLKLRSLYNNGRQSFVFGQFSPNARVEMISESQKMKSNSMGGIRVKVTNGDKVQEQLIFGAKGLEGRPRMFAVGTTQLAISYGAKRMQLPFSLYLREFILEKYPGTNSASSYASEVTLIDPRTGIEREQRIFMNNIMDHDGYRFFQSSFDQDELGTYLSVNYDFWGTWISYLGYGILTIGMFLTFFTKSSRFQQLARNNKKLQGVPKVATILMIGFMLYIGSPLQANAPPPLKNTPQIDLNHATKFGYLVMQDHRGRMKPMNTYTSEILRKLSRKSTLYGLTSEQIILGMAAHSKDWYHVPLIKMGKHQETLRLIPVKGDLAKYSDFFDTNGAYKLKQAVRDAYNTPKKDRGVFEKEMMKLDEKINIVSMVFSGNFMKVFPVPGDENNTWEAPVGSHGNGQAGDSFSRKFYSAYIPTLKTAMADRDWNLANRLIDELGQYQQKFGAAVIPSETKIKAELLLNEMSVFSRLAGAYALLGFSFLGLLFATVFKPTINIKTATKITLGLFTTCFLLHTLGLGLRWYVSGRAPWSNGYESMIYIAFTTTLAGLLFSRKSTGGLAATCILSSTILLVAGLSWLDPEITPLVPVLKSYWLTIHVSLEAGSYGFLMLGAIIGVINLLFMIFRNQHNAKNVNRMIKELGQISEMTVMGGLFMVSIGTYLGGVWANESWGRYWGWDAKETWALVTILVYAFILHMRFIPGLRGAYAYNVGTLFGWASVIMTYFGVNYYLSGLHSYAAGDPVPIPNFVYYAVAVLTVISLVAGWRNSVFNKT